jgi:hypothetical protein
MRDLAAVSIPVLINQRNIEGEGDRQGGLLNSSPADPVSAPVLGPNESLIVSLCVGLLLSSPFWAALDWRSHGLGRKDCIDVLYIEASATIR